MTGRDEQLNSLNGYYESDRNNLTILYGRHRIGRTGLIREFIADKPAAYYSALPAVDFEQIRSMNRAFTAQLNSFKEADNYSNIFTGIFNSGIKVLVVEEFQNIVKADPDFMNSVAALVKGELSAGKVMVILATSSIAWVENSMVRAIVSAAFSINAFMKLKELNYVDTVSLFPESDTNSNLCMYGVTGGIPGYMTMWNGAATVKENICGLILNRDGKLYKEAITYIRDEFREIGVYNTILGCLAAGRNKLNEIYEYTGFGRDKISVYLKNLIEREIVEKIFSYDAGGSEYTRKGLYRIKDSFINFWYGYVYPYASQLELLGEYQFYDTYIEGRMDGFLQAAFIKIAGEFLDILNDMGRLPYKAERKGSWYGKMGDIHVIMEAEDGRAVIGQAYIGSEPVTVEQYEQLMENTGLAGINADCFYLFSSGGFDDKLRSISSDKLILVGIDEL